MIYIALFDRELLRDIFWPIVKVFQVLAERVAVLAAEVRMNRRPRPDAEVREEEEPGAKNAETKAQAEVPETAIGEPRPPSVDDARRSRGAASSAFAGALNLVVIILCILALFVAWPRPPSDTPDAPGERAEIGAPSESRFVQVGANENCWRVARACTGSGARWIEMRALNPELRIEGARCIVQQGDVLKVPVDWVCPAGSEAAAEPAQDRMIERE